MLKALVTDCNTPFDDANSQIMGEKVELIFAEKFEEDHLIDKVRDCDALCSIFVFAKITRRIIEAGKKLKVIARYGVGTDNIDVKAATEQGIVVTNCPRYHLPTMPEHIIALMFALARKVTIADKSVRNSQWNHELAMGVDIEGKTLGIVGFGKIGSTLAAKATALGMKVIAYDSCFSPDQKHIDGVEIKSFEDIVKESDFLSINVPLTETTRNLFNSSVLKKMKKNSYLINTSRGAVIDEDAMYDALVNNRIAGAALDVMAKEPPDKNHKLFSLNNVIITPHCGGSTVEAFRRVGDTAAKSIIDVLCGKKPEYACNPEVLRTLNLK